MKRCWVSVMMTMCLTASPIVWAGEETPDLQASFTQDAEMLPTEVSKASHSVGALILEYRKGTETLGYAFCTASLISIDLILTNSHCLNPQQGVQPIPKFMIAVPGQDRWETYIATDVVVNEFENEVDVAILRLEEPVRLKDVLPLPIAVPKMIPKHPWRMSYYVDFAFLSNPRPGNAPNFFLEVCSRRGVSNNVLALSFCSGRSGNSGSPIVNHAGEIVGLLKAIDYEPPKAAVKGTEFISGKVGMIYANPSSTIRDVIKKKIERTGGDLRRTVSNEWERLRVESMNYNGKVNTVYWP